MGIKSTRLGIAIVAFTVLSWASTAQAIMLFDYGFNIDGTKTYQGDPLPGSVDASGFDFVSGLGVIDVSVGGAGTRYVSLFVDHDIDVAANTFYNELGAVSGTVAAGQSWEIDEPGYFDGDIFENFQAGALDNGIGTSIYGDTYFPDDVSMALGWDFSLTGTETATVSYLLSEVMPSTGFYLTHSDPESQVSFYFSSSLTIRGDDGGGQVPEPASVLLLGIGLLGMAGVRRRARKG